jgi:hypothetical protein
MQGAPSCARLVNRVLTYTGFCFASNMLGINQIFNTKVISKEFESYRRKNITKTWYEEGPLFNDDIDEPGWSLEGGYKDASVIFPRRAEEGFFLSFGLVLDENDLKNLCFFRFKSFLAYLHLPNEMPTIFHDDYFVRIEDLKTIKVETKLITADSSLRSYKPEIRNCYFEGCYLNFIHF